MLTLIEKGKPEEAHPSFWAPFVVVGGRSAATGHDRGHGLSGNGHRFYGWCNSGKARRG